MFLIKYIKDVFIKMYSSLKGGLTGTVGSNQCVEAMFGKPFI